jgi:hypothetical protein
LLDQVHQLIGAPTSSTQQLSIPPGTTEPEGGNEALEPPIDLLNDDSDPPEDEFVDFVAYGESIPTHTSRPLRDVCDPKLWTPTEDTARHIMVGHK